MELIKKILLKIERFNQSQWLFVSIFTTSSGLWFPFIITYLGSPLRLLTRDSNGVVHWKPLGIIITVLTIFWSFISILAKRYSEYRNNANDFPDNGDNLFESVLDAICKVGEKTEFTNGALLEKSDEKLTLINYCKLHKNTLQCITEQMCKLLSKLLSTREFNLREKDIVVNIYYCFPTIDDQWHRADSHQLEFGLTMEDLLQENTTFYECVHGGSDYVFHYSKHKAAEENHYVFDNRDIEPQNRDGSIACFRYKAVKHDATYIKCMIVISTYGKKMAAYKTENMEKEKIDNIKYNLYENIFKTFKPLITNTLFNYYAHEKLNPRE